MALCVLTLGVIDRAVASVGDMLTLLTFGKAGVSASTAQGSASSGTGGNGMGGTAGGTSGDAAAKAVSKGVFMTTIAFTPNSARHSETGGNATMYDEMARLTFSRVLFI
jgi:hypothetical protein